MKTPSQSRPTVKGILDEHVTLTVECLDRLYFNGYTPVLQTEAGRMRFLVDLLHFHGASPAILGQITRGYVRRVEAHIQKPQLPAVDFRKGERKDKIAPAKQALAAAGLLARAAFPLEAIAAALGIKPSALNGSAGGSLARPDLVRLALAAFEEWLCRLPPAKAAEFG